MQIDTEEEPIDRWCKSSIHSDDNHQSRSPSPSTLKKKKKSRHSPSKSKKKKKHKRTKSKKKKKSNKTDRWDPSEHTEAHKPTDTVSNTSKIKITFNKPPPKTNKASPIRDDSRSKTPPKTKCSPTQSKSPVPHKRSSSRSMSQPKRSRSRSRSRSNSYERNGRNRRYNDRDRRYYKDRGRYNNKSSRDHFTDSPPPRSHYGSDRYRGRDQRINHKVIAALNEIQEKHKDDNTHPLDLKQQELKKNCARKKDKAMIWAAASGNFQTEILNSPQFQKNISLALKTTNKDFDIAVLFKQFSNYSVKLVWLDCSDRASGIKKSELLTFRDLMSIRSYRKELNHCDALWKFIFYDQRHLFWSMAIYYALIRTTLVPEWDQMFKKQFDLIKMYGKTDYIEKDVELLEEDKNRSRRDRNRRSRERDRE